MKYANNRDKVDIVIGVTARMTARLAFIAFAIYLTMAAARCSVEEYVRIDNALTAKGVAVDVR